MKIGFIAAVMLGIVSTSFGNLKLVTVAARGGQHGGWSGSQSEAVRAFLRPRTATFGADPALYNRAIAQRDALPPAVMGGGSSYAPYSVWAPAGTNNLGVPYAKGFGIGPISGRKTGIAVAQIDPEIMYVSTAGGGVWKSIDAGQIWKPMSDRWAYLDTSCIAIHPTNPNTVYAGTGDWRGFFQSRTQGIMRTVDGGVTWTQVGTPRMKSETITKIQFNPEAPQQILCTTAGGEAPNYGGIYKSTNNGLTWTLKQSGHHYVDMSLGTLGAIWITAVGPDTPGQRGLIQKTFDFGNSFDPSPNPAANAQTTLLLDASTVNGNSAYLLAPNDQKVFKTINGGANWTDVTGNFPMGTAADPLYNWSDPASNAMIGCSRVGGADLVFVGMKTIAQSLGGNGVWLDIGRSYSEASPNYLHEGFNAFLAHPTIESLAYFGCDGGVFRYSYNANPTAANFVSLNATLRDTMHYHTSLHPTDLSYVMSGTQDNATPASRGNLAVWGNLYAGTGGWSGFDQTNPGIHMTTSAQGTVWRYTNPTDALPDNISPAPPATWTGAYITPTVLAGVSGSQLYTADNRLKRWTGGTSWVSVSPLLTPNANEYVTTIGVAPTATTVMYTGSSDGYVYRTANNTTNWNQVRNGADSRTVGGIAVSWTNTNDILVGYQDFGGNHLWRCTNTSVAVPTFTNVSGNLPEAPVNAVAFDPYNADVWYVATDVGVFSTKDGGATYLNMTALGLPNVHVTSLTISKNKAYMYAATFGRGLWRIQFTSTPNPFSIAGTIRTVDDALFSGVTVTLKKFREYQLAYSNNTATPIPDNDMIGIAPGININLGYAITGGTLNLNITHPNRGDLEITLVAPDAREWRVQNVSADTGDNIIANIDFNGFANGALATGLWTLRIRDLVGGNVGILNSWKVIPKFYTYVTQTSMVTPASGAYSFTGLEAGKYYVVPSFTGKTWVPRYRVINIGPSRTGQDFKAFQ